ncbi:MAG: hypothetical protein U9N81_00520 [Bacillota bacterium]|nr:hypothetical protein [Bacillota bacterium]
MAEHKSDVLRLSTGAINIEDTGIGNVMMKGQEDAPPESRSITIGLEGDDFIEIIEGLNEGDEVVLNGMSPGGPPMETGY